MTVADPYNTPPARTPDPLSTDDAAFSNDSPAYGGLTDGSTSYGSSADDRAAFSGNAAATEGAPSDAGATDAAREQAGKVKDAAAGALSSVADTAKEQAGSVLSEATGQVKELAGQAGSELSSQASSAQNRLADSVRALAGELSSMASHDANGDAATGMVTDLVRQGADRAQTLADWLTDREPKEVLDEVSRYARSHPGTFLALAAGAGVLAGRLVRGLKDDSATGTDVGGSADATGTSQPVATFHNAGAADITPAAAATYPA